MRNLGGYIEDAQLAMLGVEIYQDIHGTSNQISPNFIIPEEDAWPVHLWGYELGARAISHKIIDPIGVLDSKGLVQAPPRKV